MNYSNRNIISSLIIRFSVFLLLMLPRPTALFFAQEIIEQDHINLLRKVLFVTSMDCVYPDSVYSMHITYQNKMFIANLPFCTEDFNKANALISEIRHNDSPYDTTALIEIIKEYETKFNSEWEPTWMAGHMNYERQYEILMHLELTLASLRLSTISDKFVVYNYLKNLYMVQWGDDGDIEKCNFVSEYLKTKWNGKCVSSWFCGPRLIGEKIHAIGEYFLDDINGLNIETLSDPQKGFYKLDMLINYNSLRVEEVLLNNIDKINKLAAFDTHNLHRPVVYRVIGRRGNEQAIARLLEMTRDVDLLHIFPTSFDELLRTETGRKLMANRLAEILLRVEDPIPYVSMLTKFDGQKYLHLSQIERINERMPEADKIQYQDQN